MPTDVIMPALGMAQETGKVLRWLKGEGESVVKGEPLLEVETDKVTVEVEAPADGTLAALRAQEGDDVPVGRPVAVILAEGEEAPEPVAVSAAAAPSAAARETSSAGSAEDGRSAVQAQPRPRRPLASPKARRLAHEHGVDLDSVSGSGPHGAVVAADVEQAPAAAPEAVEAGAVWQRMAERTERSWQTVPHFFLMREVDAGRLQTWRDEARSRPGYEGLTHTDLLLKICAAALREHPRVNATWQDGSVVAQDDVNVGVAVATDDGLVVPVVHAADRLELREIVAERSRLVKAARQGKLKPDDVSGGTFTVSNLGMYGVDAFLAIVNAPQAAILSLGRIADRVVPVDGSPVVRPTLVLGLSFDHRVVDGARGAEFLDALAGLIEEPAGLVA